MPIALALASFLLNLVLGWLVLYSNPKRSTNQQYFFLSSIGSLWLLALAFSFGCKDQGPFLFWVRTTCVLGAFVPLGFSFVRVAIIEPGITFRSLIRKSSWQIVGLLSLAAFSVTPYHIQGVSFPSTGIPNTINGTLPFAYPLGFLIATAHETWMIIRGLRKSRGIKRFELSFLLIGAGILIVLGALPILVVPLVAANSQGVIAAPLWIISMDAVIAYGIITKRILDVGSLTRRAISLTLFAGYVVIAYFSIFTITSKITGTGSLRGTLAIPNIASTLVLLLTMNWARGFLDRTLIKRIDPVGDWKNAREPLEAMSNQQELVTAFESIVREIATTDRAAVRMLLPDQRLDPIETLLQTSAPRKPILREALGRRRNRASMEPAIATLDAGKWALAIGIFQEDALIGVVYLAERLSGRLYSQREQQALSFIVDQFSNTLANLTLNHEVAKRDIESKTLLDNLVSGVVAVDIDGKVTTTNPEARRILGHKSASIEDITLPQEIEDVLQTILTADKGAHHAEIEVHLDESALTPSTLRVGGARLLSNDQQPTGALLVIHDISSERQLERHVRHSDRLATIGKVSASVAHEIKNPLVAIKAFAQLLPERKTDEAFLAQFSRLVDGEVERINTAIGGLLNYARTESKPFSAISVHQEIKDSADLLSAEFRKKHLHVELDLVASRDAIMGDASQIKQMLVNLLLNANDAMENHGHVVIATRVTDAEGATLINGSATTDGKLLEVTITDDGEGIPEVDVNQVLMPFFTTKKGGTGLGLPLVASLVSQHGGTMRIDSTPGEGTSITLSFPLLDGQAIAGSPLGLS